MHPRAQHIVLKQAGTLSLLHNPRAALLQEAEDHLQENQLPQHYCWTCQPWTHQLESPVKPVPRIMMQHHFPLWFKTATRVDFEAGAAAASAGASWSRGTSAVATEQMLAQQPVWRRSQLAALSAAGWQVTSVARCGAAEKPSQRSLPRIFSFKWPKDSLMLRQISLRQRVSIKNLRTTARRWSSRRVGGIPRLRSVCAINKLLSHESSWAASSYVPYIMNRHRVWNKKRAWL